MNIILVILLGLVVGSFLNAVIYRLHAGVSFLKGRSYCPKCKHDLSFWDLIPLGSYIILKGKCRYCQKVISWQYPLVEFGTMLAFVFLYGWFGLDKEFFVYIFYTCILIVIFVYDLRYYLILDKVSLPAMVITFFLSVFILKIDLWHIIIGMLLGGGFFLLQFLISRGKWIGGGDIRLGILIGAMLGYQGLLVALFASYLSGSIIGILLVVFGRKKWKSHIPFGTFLTAATYLTILFGDLVIDYYQNILLL